MLGYSVKAAAVRDCIALDGRRVMPGDPGFLAAQYGRLRLGPMPAGWMFEDRATLKLYALIDGNPVLLEAHARALGLFASARDRPAVARP